MRVNDSYKFVWILLAAAAVCAFAACHFGFAACDWAKPLGLGLALASAAASFLDVGDPSREN